MASYSALRFLCVLLACHQANARSVAAEPGASQHRRISLRSVKYEDVIEGVNWTQKGQDELNEALNFRTILKPTKNVIFFIGDGMGISTQTPARFLKAQLKKQPVTDTYLSWEKFPTTGIIKTYNVDQQTPDSAGTATAFMTGEKARAGVIAVNQNVPRGDCPRSIGNEAKSILHHSMDAGKWTGVITTARITHATPSCAYAHSADRYWESDFELNNSENTESCKDIAWQLVFGKNNENIKVILGGGRRSMLPNTTADPEYPEEMGYRQDGLNLIEEWKTKHEGKKFKYVDNLTDFENVDSSTVEYLMGLFEYTHMKYEALREEDEFGEPSLADMVSKSIEILKKGKDGYFLYVEGARIDHAHHDTNAYNALHDTLALEEAVQAAVSMTNEEDTLIVVTADHSHTFTMAGYPRISNNIFGTVENINGDVVMADDDKPYLTLGYVNGPGYLLHRTENGSLDEETTRRNLTDVYTGDAQFLQDTGVPLQSETHGGEDVAVFARGPMSHLFNGIHEQNFIPHVMGYASCVGWNKDLCENPTQPPPTSGGQRPSTGLFVLYLLLALSVWFSRL